MKEFVDNNKIINIVKRENENTTGGLWGLLRESIEKGEAKLERK